MGFREKLIKAAEFAVKEERGRILWLIETMETEIRLRIGQKLVSDAELHALNVKLQLFKAFTTQLRRGIVSGVRPPDKKPKIPNNLPEDI